MSQNTKKNHPQLQTINFNIIPDHLIVKMLKKFTFIEGTRARKTCKFIDDLVCKAKIAFANYETARYHLYILIRKHGCDFSISGYSGNTGKVLTDYYTLSPNEALESIVFEKIRVDGFADGEHDQIEPREIETSGVFSLLKKTSLKCRRLNFCSVYNSDFTRILSSISCKSIYDESPQPIYETIDAIRTSSTCRNLYLTATEMPYIEISLERIAHLKNIRIFNESAQWEIPFKLFLQEVQCKPPGFLKYVDVDISPINDGDQHPTNSWPNSNFVWQGAIRIFGFVGVSFYYQFHLMETQWNTLIIITYDRAAGLTKHVKVVFVQKNNCEEIVFTVFDEVTKIQKTPIDMSAVYEELCTSTPDGYSLVLRKYLELICP